MPPPGCIDGDSGLNVLNEYATHEEGGFGVEAGIMEMLEQDANRKIKGYERLFKRARGATHVPPLERADSLAWRPNGGYSFRNYDVTNGRDKRRRMGRYPWTPTTVG